jgi:hypothetical protein
MPHDNEAFETFLGLFGQTLESTKKVRTKPGRSIHLKGYAPELDAYQVLCTAGFEVEMTANSGRYQATNHFDLCVEGLRIEVKHRRTQFALFLKWLSNADILWITTNDETPLVVITAATFLDLLQAHKKERHNAIGQVPCQSTSADLGEGACNSDSTHGSGASNGSRQHPAPSKARKRRQHQSGNRAKPTTP